MLQTCPTCEEEREHQLVVSLDILGTTCEHHRETIKPECSLCFTALKAEENQEGEQLFFFVLF